MSRILLVLLLMIWALSASARQLLFTGYVQGTGSNKALEVYNPSGSSVDLDRAQVEIYANGSATPSATMPLLPVELPPGL